jgi:hypothetical protein
MEPVNSAITLLTGTAHHLEQALDLNFYQILIALSSIFF